MKKILNKGYKIIAYFAIVVVLLLINYNHIFSTSILKNLVFLVLAIIIGVLINKFIINKLKDKTLGMLIVGFLVLFAILEIASVFYFRVEYNWDFGWIMTSAEQISSMGKLDYTFYYKMFPNNWGALIIATLSMMITKGNQLGAYIVNIILVLLSAIFATLSAKKIGGNKLALNTILLIVGCAPLYLYTPIVYTDTMSVAFPVMTLYFWLVSNEYKEKSKKVYYANICLMAICGAIGYCIKPVAGIVLVAIIIDEIFTNLNKETIKKICIAVLLSVIFIGAFNKYGEKVIIKDSKKNDLEFPMTHWVMMGLGVPESEGGTSNGYGGYSQKDADYTAESGNYEEKKKANILKIKERLKEFKIEGYIKFLFNKFDYVWNDGSYYVLNVIGWDTINKTSLPYKMIINTEYNKPFVNYMEYFNNYLFVAILIGIILELTKKEKNQAIRVLGISIVGIAMFLLIWEARSRYIYFLIPVFCILSAYGILQISKYIEERLNKKNKNV